MEDPDVEGVVTLTRNETKTPVNAKTTRYRKSSVIFYFDGKSAVCRKKMDEKFKHSWVLESRATCHMDNILKWIYDISDQTAWWKWEKKLKSRHPK